MKDFCNGSSGKSCTTCTLLVVEHMFCTSASQHYCILFYSMTRSIFTHPIALHFGDASMGTMCELHEEQLSASDDDEEGHNTWSVLLVPVTDFGFGARIQSKSGR